MQSRSNFNTAIMTPKRKIINDPVYDGFLSVDDPVILSVIEHPFFQRQRRIKQLGLSHLVYPGAMHTRFSHMLGALNLMGRALNILRQKGIAVSDDEVRAARLAILLHDIGHGPFSHTSERVLVNVPHEQITEMFIERMIDEWRSKPDDSHSMAIAESLTTALQIFRNKYHRHFLHQLVSSQLDVDRLDYLGRDSFFTGVSEGIVGTDRIISMFNVHDDELVIDEKGIYSVEKFIISRRLMYWQVYMHKTVIAADQVLLAILRRVRDLLENGTFGVSELPMPLGLFLSHHYTADDFRRDPSLLERFAELDDDDIMVAVKHWRHSPDKVLGRLCYMLVNRCLPAIKLSSTRPDPIEVQGDDAYFSGTGILRNRSYDFADQEIKVLFKDGRCVSISEASDQLDRHFLEKQVVKYYSYRPKENR